MLRKRERLFKEELCIVTNIILNDTLIHVHRFSLRKVNHSYEMSVDFHVRSEEYHDIAMLLYEEVFDVYIPKKEISFKGSIQQYSTSITNLYEKGQVGEYSLTLLEVEN